MVCVGPGQKPKLLVFSHTGSNVSLLYGPLVNIDSAAIFVGEEKPELKEGKM